MDTFDLRGRVVIVTGSTKGIGKAIAAGFCRAGAKVVVSSRKADACEAVTAELNREQARDGGEAVSIPCHAGKLDELEALVSRTLDRWGKITTCVPNAAANPYHGGLAGIPDSAFDKIMETNVRATFWLCRLVLPHLVERGDGSIVIIASIAGLKGSPDLGAYAHVQGRVPPARSQPRGGVRPARGPGQRDRSRAHQDRLREGAVDRSGAARRGVQPPAAAPHRRSDRRRWRERRSFSRARPPPT